MVFNELNDGKIILSTYCFGLIFDRPYEQIANISDRTFLFRDVA
jgi:hypothetical protein